MGVIALGHRGHIEEVSTETQQGNRSGVWGGVGAALIHQIAVPAAGQDCRTGPLPKLPRWLPPSWDPLHRSFCQPGHGGHWLLLCFPRHPLTSDDAKLVVLGPCLQGITSRPWVSLPNSSQHEKVRAGDMEEGFQGGLLRFLYFLQEHVQWRMRLDTRKHFPHLCAQQ